MNPYSINIPIRIMQNRKAVKEDVSFDEVSFSESDVFRAAFPFGQNPDPVVRVKGLKVYAEMCEDDQIKACLELRKQARFSTPWNIASAEDGNAKADMYADFIKQCLKRMSGTFEDNLYSIFSAIEYGFSVTEKVFEIIPDGDFKGKIGLKALKTREPFGYDFKTDEHGNILGIVYSGIGSLGPVNLNGQNMPGSNDDPFPTDKFIIYAYNSQFSNPYGRSDLLAAFRSWASKRIIMRFWNIWLERYASPFVWAEYETGVGLKKGVMDAVDDFIKNLSAKTGIRVPKGVKFNFLEMSGTKGGKSYEEAIEAHNRFMAHAILCPNLLGYTQQQAPGSFALGKKHFDAFLWVLEKMGRDASETIVGEQIIKQLITINFPGVDDKILPHFKFEGIEEEGIEARARIIAILHSSGFIDPAEPWVREFLTLPKRDPEFMPKPGENSSQQGSLGTERTPSKKPVVPDKEEFKHSEQLRREPNEFEKKIKVKEYAKQLDSAEDSFFTAVTNELEAIRNQVVDFVVSKKIIESGNAKEVERVPINVGPLKEILRRWLVKAFLDSKLKQFEELGRAGINTEVERRFLDIEAPFEPWAPLPPREAVDFFNRKVKARITGTDGKKKLIELATRKELSFYDEKAFAVSGIVRDDILGDVKQVLLNGIKRHDIPGAVKDLKDLFSRYIRQGVAIDDKLLEPHRLRTIVRTNLVEAVNEGRRSMMQHDDVKDFVQFWEYSAILDTHTSDYCSCMDAKVFRSEDLALLQPPAHFNSVVEGTKILTFDGIKKVEDIRPDDFVMTHKRRWRRVYVTMRKKNDLNSFKEIKTSTGRTLRVTDEHPVLTLDGWKFVSDLKIGDKAFQSIKKSDRVFDGTMVHPEYFPSLFDQPSVSFDVVNFSRRSLMSFSVDLDGDFKVEKSKINDKPSNRMLKFERHEAGRKNPEHDGFRKGRFVSQGGSKGTAHFDYSRPFAHRISGDHADRMSFVYNTRFFSHTPSPVVFAGRTDVGRICDGCLKPFASDSYAMPFTPTGEKRFSHAETSFDSSDGLSSMPMPFKNQFIDEDSISNVHDLCWILTTIISIVDVDHQGNVYNLGVEEDETYTAEDIIVHNCRSLAVPITQFEVERMVDRGEGVEVSDPCPSRLSGFQEKNFFFPIEPLPLPDALLWPSDRGKVKPKLTCPYSGCGSDEVIVTGSRFNRTDYICGKCRLPFRLTETGDLYLFDTGEEKWQRITRGLSPSYFKRK